MVLPQYNRETDTLYYIGIIDGEDVGEKFMNSGEAIDYLDSYYTYGNVRESLLNADDLDESSLEYALEKRVGKPVSDARNYLESLGFNMFVMAGPSKRNDTWEEYTTNEDKPGSISVKLYFDLIPDRKDSRRKKNGNLTDFFVDRY